MESVDIAKLRNEKYNATVHHIHKSHSDLMVIRVRPDKKPIAHKSGQYTLLGLGNWEPRFPGTTEENLPETERSKLVRRSYSISASVLDNNGQLADNSKEPWVEFYIVLVRETASGKAPALTPRLFMLKEGDRLFCGEKITGAYTLDLVKPTDSVIFLGTGTGEAPHNYMLQQLLNRKHEGKIVSGSCVRLKKDHGYLSIRSGELESKLGSKLDPASTHVFLCGNPAMIGVPEKNRETGEYSYPKPEGVIEVLEQKGFKADKGHHDRGNIHFEEYWS